MKRGPIVVAILLLTVWCHAAVPNVVGTWIGTFHLSKKPIKMPKDKNAQKLIQIGILVLKNTKFNLSLKTNHTFKMQIKTTLQGKSKLEISTGSYVQKGSHIYTTTTARDGKKIPKSDITKRHLVLSKDEKSMVLDIKQGVINGKVILKK